MHTYRSWQGPRRSHPGSPGPHRRPSAGGCSARCDTGSWTPHRCGRWLPATRIENSQHHPLAPPRPPGAAEERAAWGLSEWWGNLRRWNHNVTQAEVPAESCASTTRGSAIPCCSGKRAWGFRHTPAGTGDHGQAPGCPGPEPELPPTFTTLLLMSSLTPASSKDQRLPWQVPGGRPQTRPAPSGPVSPTVLTSKDLDTRKGCDFRTPNKLPKFKCGKPYVQKA